MKRYILFTLIIACILYGIQDLYAQNVEDTIPYKLAVIHTRNLNFTRSFLGDNNKPDRATVAEFQWIMATLKHRCINPQGQLADIILKVWQTIRGWGNANMSLLDVARSLTVVTKNVPLFGFGKVNFKKTASYWLLQNKPKKKKILNSRQK